MKALVIGGGIGGLTVAIALRKAGLDVTVFERTRELREIGAGITLWANAIKALRELGLRDAVRALGWPPPEVSEASQEIRSPGGNVLYEIPAGVLEGRLGEENVIMARPDLQETLLRELREAGGEVRLGSRFVAFEEGGEVARFADGSEERGDLLVGADGLRSAVRERLHGDGPPHYAGYVAWQGIVDREANPLPSRSGFFTLGRDSRFGLIKLNRGRHYWYATRNVPEEVATTVASSEADLLAHFGSWHAPIPEVIRTTGKDAIYCGAIYHRPPLGSRWGKDRITLLGDAAHPMTPDLGQGACQAIEDAVVLARFLGEGVGVEASSDSGLLEY